MHVDYDPIHPFFKLLPFEVQEKGLELIKRVNELHLHCEDNENWLRIHYMITAQFTNWYIKKQSKHFQATMDPVDGQPIVPSSLNPGGPCNATIPTIQLSQVSYEKCLMSVQAALNETYHDPLFTTPILEGLQQHILTQLCDNAQLVNLLCKWIVLNAMYLPLGTHLVEAFREDMAGSSSFSKHMMTHQKIQLLPEALSEKSVFQMTAFLSEVAQAHSRYCGPRSTFSIRPTAIMLSVKNGPGGHMAPTQAMAGRLKERGWKVETINYDEDLSAECDAFQLLGITFEDSSPMTKTLFASRWTMQKHNRDVACIVSYYVTARINLAPDLFLDDSGGDLLRRKILPLNPQLIITTLAYHWCWKSLAYRILGAKILLAASDAFFHQQAMGPWYRQQSIDPTLRNIHFTLMTDDLEILKSKALHHDQYYIKKYPNVPVDSMIPFYEGLKIDSQHSIIGAPIHPGFKAVTDSQEIKRLRHKWGVLDGEISICISRGKQGYDSDLLPALDSYRTPEKLPLSIVLQVVCGENTPFYQKLREGFCGDLGSSIKIHPHPLLEPKDFAELRAISLLDDIKAGGGSTFEGWYLISEGANSLLLLTPGPALWWEKSNCDAMEKWGIGRTVSETTSKIAIIKDVIQNGLPPIVNKFPNWKPLFDRVADSLVTWPNVYDT